jgi:hypothetical protein
MIKRIPLATRVLGKSQGYLGLPVCDVNHADGSHEMLTAWEPTPAEIEAINRGEPIVLSVLGTGHPPVKLSVGLPKVITDALARMKP